MSNFLQRNDGGFFLLNDGIGCILLNTDTGGVIIKNQHATPLVGRRGQQLITVEFTFILKSCLITKAKIRVCMRSTLRAVTKTNVKVKSFLLSKFKESFAITSHLLRVQQFNTVKLKASTLVIREAKIGLFANTKNKNMKKVILTKFKKKKLKELLLRRLKEELDKDGR